jgi:hypothetical protein
MLHLPRGDQVLHRPGDVLDRHARVDPVLVQEVDRLHLQAPQRGVGDLADVRGPRIEAVARAVGVDAEAELRADDHLLAERRQRLPKQLLVPERSVRLRRVENVTPRSTAARRMAIASCQSAAGP